MYDSISTEIQKDIKRYQEEIERSKPQDVLLVQRTNEEGTFGMAELEQAAHRAGQNTDTLKAILMGTAPMPMRPVNTILTFAERHDQQYGSDWHTTIIRQAALWCAVQVPEGQNRWLQLCEPDGLYSSWCEAAQFDRTLEIAGLKGWRKWVRDLPEEADTAIAAMVNRLELAPDEREDYLYRLLGGVFGGASYLRRSTWAASSSAPGALADLLAIRICCDAAVAHLAPHPAEPIATDASLNAVEDENVLAIFQEALEDGYARRMLGNIGTPPSQPIHQRPALRAAFCVEAPQERIEAVFDANPDVKALVENGWVRLFALDPDSSSVQRWVPGMEGILYPDLSGSSRGTDAPDFR
jgi:uncharacterized protein YbcC (UPF0753/DUF2309 family)